LTGFCALALAVLTILLMAGANVPGMQLWLIILCFLLIIAFAIPFFLVIFGVIDERSWLRTFGWVLDRIPVLRHPPARDKDTQPYSTEEPPTEE
jgi:hypothetical protein